ncbi:MAG: glutamate racemase, partial [Parcubacteria group bacterium CG23_combo_of_CG06-09_8_20_14_all_35_9]
LLVSLVEEGWFKKPETKRIVKRYLYPLKIKQIDTLILGCTHYPLIKDLIQIKIGRRVRLVDSGEEVVKEVQKYLKENSGIERSLKKSQNHEFYFSDLNPRIREISSRWLKRSVKPKVAKI